MQEDFHVQLVTVRCPETLRFTTFRLTRGIVVFLLNVEFSLQVSENYGFSFVGKVVWFGEDFIKKLYPSDVQKTFV